MVSRHNLGMNDGWRIVPGVFSLGEGLADHGLAQVSLRVTLAHALSHRRFKVTTDHVCVLPHFKEDNGAAAVLA